MKGIHSILSRKSEDLFDTAIGMVSSSTPLREAIDMINSAKNGALLCVGDVQNILRIGNGGFRIDSVFTPQRLFELSKMDGAILLSDDARQIICANFHLNPDPSIPTAETGMRHRSASRTSAETEALVIAISKRRTQTTLYKSGEGLTLDSNEVVLQKSNQGLLALQNYRNNLERASMRLSFLEMDDISTVADVTDVLIRYIRIFILATETEQLIDFLGSDGRLLRGQLEEIVRGLADSFILVIRDYAVESSLMEARKIARALLRLAPTDDSDEVIQLLGYQDVTTNDHLSPRGFRAISRISMLDEEAVARIIDEYGSLRDIVSDSKEGFDRMEGLGIDNVRALAKSFMQLRSTI